MSINVTTEPLVEPITVEDAKLWTRIDASADDATISRLITHCRIVVENWARQKLINQTITWTLDDGFWSEYRIPIGPLSSVTSIKYIDTGGTQQTLATSQYTADTTSKPGRIVPAYGITWPSTRDQINAVEIKYVAGFGTAGSSVPAPFLQALYMLVDHAYENRGAAVDDATVAVPLAIQHLLSPYSDWQ